MDKKLRRIELAREAAISLDVLWICRSLWLEGPLTRAALVERIGRRRFESARDANLLIGIKTRAGTLYTVGPRGRLALARDRSSLPLPPALELAFARRAVAELVLRGLKPYRKRTEGQGPLEGSEEQGRGAGRLYVDPAGVDAWLLVGLPNPKPVTVGRLVHGRADGAHVYLVAQDERLIEKWSTGNVFGYTWSELIPDLNELHRPALERLLREHRTT